MMGPRNIFCFTRTLAHLDKRKAIDRVRLRTDPVALHNALLRKASQPLPYYAGGL